MIKLIYITYILFYVTIPLRRFLFVWPEETAGTFEMMMKLSKLFPFAFMTFWLFYELKIIRWGWWPNLKVVNTIAISLLVVIIGLRIAQVPGAWWTWISVGNVIALWALGYNLFYSRIPRDRLFFMSVAAAFFLVGFWETIYQVTNWSTIYWGWYGYNTLIKEIMIEIPFIAPALLIFPTYHLFKKNWKSNPLVPTMIIFFIALWGIWLSMGYWVDIYHKPIEDEWVYSEGTALGLLQLQLSKLSKVVLGICLLSVIGGYGEDRRVSAA